MNLKHNNICNITYTTQCSTYSFPWQDFFPDSCKIPQHFQVFQNMWPPCKHHHDQWINSKYMSVSSRNIESNLWNEKSKVLHTHTHQFNGPFSGTTRVSRYQKGKTNLDFTEARDSEWQCHQLGHMQVCISLQTDNHASTSLLSFFTGQMPFLLPNQQL